MKTPPLTFTQDNFCAVINGAKTETRRLSNGSDKPKYNVGDRCYLTEPTQIESDDTNIGLDHLEVQLSYFWHKPELARRQITESDLDKIFGRKSGINSKQIARFMLKSFARYWVEIVDVKLERLLDITAEAAIAEGIKFQDYRDDVGYYRSWFDYTTNSFRFKDPILSYISEIEMLYGKAIAQSNPWLWVYKFTLVGVE